MWSWKRRVAEVADEGIATVWASDSEADRPFPPSHAQREPA